MIVIYNKENDSWNLGPAYDLTYALNPLFTFKTMSRALSINAKRTQITLEDVLYVADEFSIKNPNGIIREVQSIIPKWTKIANELEIPEKIVKRIDNEFIRL